MNTYSVRVRRQVTTVEHAEIEVEARDRREAESKALTLADTCDVTWTIGAAQNDNAQLVSTDEVLSESDEILAAE